ncbi:MAG: hypothetical protein DRN27_08645 [Thermoplasmata archaeon]|nr:MAG: hypothetical protein DRN27_08645 [Thermoplasmata archaeon]
MGIFNENQGGDFIFPPVEGQKLTVTIVGEVKRVKNDNEQGNYLKKGGINVGYYDTVAVVDAEGEEAVMKINTWALYFSLKDMTDLDIGDEIEIDHCGRGEYKITKK